MLRKASMTAAISKSEPERLTRLSDLCSEAAGHVARARMALNVETFDTDQALALFERHLDAALTQGMDCIEGNLRADRAWCRLRDRQLPAARADAELAEQALLRPCSLSDRAAAHDRLRQVFDAFGDEPRAQRHAALAHQAWGEYRALQVRMVDAMDRALDGRGPA